MSKREDEKYSAWVEEFKKELPEEAVEHFEALIDLDVTREELYRGSIRSKDYYNRLNELDDMRKELEAARDELYQWYEEETPKHEALIEERDLLKKQLAERGGEGDPPPADGIPGFSNEDLAALKAKADRIDAIDKILPAVIADMGSVAMDAWKNEFTYDPHEVMRESLQKGLTPWKAYKSLTAKQREERYEKAKEEEKQKWIEEGKRQALTAKTGSPDQMPAAGPLWENLAEGDEGKPSTQQSRVAAVLQDLAEGNFD